MPIPLFDLPKIADHSSSCKSRVGFPFVIFWLKRVLVSTGQPSTNIDHPPSLAFFDPTLFLQHDVRLLHSQGGNETIFFFNLCQSTYFTLPKQTTPVSVSVRKIFPSPDQCRAWPNLSKNAKMDLTPIPCFSPPVQQAIVHLRIYVSPIYNFSNCVRPPFQTDASATILTSHIRWRHVRVIHSLSKSGGHPQYLHCQTSDAQPDCPFVHLPPCVWLFGQADSRIDRALSIITIITITTISKTTINISIRILTWSSSQEERQGFWPPLYHEPAIRVGGVGTSSIRTSSKTDHHPHHYQHHHPHHCNDMYHHDF